MNINEVKNILEKNGANVKKQFGQNFLLDDSVINKICDISNITKDKDLEDAFFELYFNQGGASHE